MSDLPWGTVRHFMFKEMYSENIPSDFAQEMLFWAEIGNAHHPVHHLRSGNAIGQVAGAVSVRLMELQEELEYFGPEGITNVERAIDELVEGRREHHRQPDPSMPEEHFPGG